MSVDCQRSFLASRLPVFPGQVRRPDLGNALPQLLDTCSVGSTSAAWWHESKLQYYRWSNGVVLAFDQLLYPWTDAKRPRPSIIKTLEHEGDRGGL